MASTPDERYAALVKALLDTTDADIGIAGKQGFGSDSLTVGGKIFAMLAKGRLVVKLPRQRVDALVAAGEGERFDPGHGRIMKEWFSLHPSSTLEWLPLAQEAMAFTDAKR